MPVVIGSKYEETKERLKQKIRDKDILVFELKKDKSKEINCICYFCGEPIYGKIYVLLELKCIGLAERIAETNYSIDENCQNNTLSSKIQE